MIETQEQLEQKIKEWGFMPFFKNAVEGFSIEELMPEDLLFADGDSAEEQGAWQWKGPIISHWELAYGKFFAGKAGFVSREWLPDFMNWRRNNYPLSSMEPDAKRILKVLRENESMLSKQLKLASGFSLSRKKKTFNPDDPTSPIINKRNGMSFDALIARLQMGTYVCIADFEYQISKKGETYGWGVARYCTPEAMYEMDYRQMVDGRKPAESLNLMMDRLQKLFPRENPERLKRIIS